MRLTKECSAVRLCSAAARPDSTLAPPWQVEDYFQNVLGVLLPSYHESYWIGLYIRSGTQRGKWVWTDPMAVAPNSTDDNAYKHWGLYRVSAALLLPLRLPGLSMHATACLHWLRPWGSCRESGCPRAFPAACLSSTTLSPPWLHAAKQRPRAEQREPSGGLRRGQLLGGQQRRLRLGGHAMQPAVHLHLQAARYVTGCLLPTGATAFVIGDARAAVVSNRQKRGTCADTHISCWCSWRLGLWQQRFWRRHCAPQYPGPGDWPAEDGQVRCCALL